MLRSTAVLLDELDPLPFPRRMRLLVERCRELPGLAADLAGGDAYQRILGITVACVLGQREVVLGVLDDPDVAVRATALRAALRAGWVGGDDLAALLADAPADLRGLVYLSLKVMRLPGHADAVIDAVRARYGDREAAALLAACGAGTVRRLLPLLAYAEVSWKGIARRHGDVVLDHAAVMLAGAARPDRARIWAELGTGILAAAPGHPEAVLDLLEGFAPEGELPRPAGDLRYLGVLCAAAPQRVIRLLVAPGRARWLGRVSLPAAVLDRIRAVDPSDLVTLGRLLRGRDPALAGLLRALPPARRGTLYDAVLAEVDTAADAPGPEVMEALPRDWRYREARRVLALPRIAALDSETVFWSAYLPWAEAVPALTGWLRSPSPIERIAANAFLVQAARHSQDPEVAAELVARLPRLRNEQDPVRAAALRGLAGLARLLRADSAPTLTTLVTDALQARDASSQTLGALGNLAVAVLTHHDDPELVRWALHTLDRLPSLPPLGTLRRGSETLIFARLRDWIVAGSDRGDFDRLFAVARALGRRAHHVPELQELLGRAVDAGNTSYVLRQAIELWLDDPRTRGDRVQAVLDADLSAVLLGRVWTTICSRRTDLLDWALLGPPPVGRFLSKGTSWAPGPVEFVRRWLPRQQRAYLDRQAAIAADPGTHVGKRAVALAAVESIPEAGRELLLRYADSAEVRLAEAALGALPWTDRPDEALPVLLAHAGDDRARVAMYAAGRAARFTRPSRLLAELRPVALGAGKVTSRKEAIRLLAGYGPPEAIDVLAEVWAQPDGHRDVRAAVVFGARERLGSATAWTILTEAASGSRAEITEVLAATPGRLAEADRPRYAALIITACGSPDREASRAAWQKLAPWVRWAPNLTGPAVAALADPGTSDSPRHATWPGLPALVGALLDHPPRPAVAAPAVPVVAPTPSPAGPEAAPITSPAGSAAAPATPDSVLAMTLRELVRRDADDLQPGGTAEDRPARRRLRAVVRAAQSWARRADLAADRGPVRRAALELGRHPRFVPDAAHLLTAALDLTAATLRDDVHDLIGLLADRPVLAAHLAETFAAAITVPDPAVLLPLSRELAAHPGPAAGFLALACVRPGATYGWSDPWREQLEHLRHHPDPEVADAAREVDMTAG